MIPRHHRDLVRIKILVGNDRQSYFAGIQNISVLGIGLVHELPLSLNTQIDICLPRTPWSQANALPAVVRHTTSRPDGLWLIGASFKRTTTADDFLALRSRTREISSRDKE